MDIDLRTHSSLSEAERQVNRDLTVLVYGPKEDRAERFPYLRLTWFGPPTWWVRVHYDNTLVSVVGILERIILVDGEHARAAGISSVMTHPDHRRKGYARAAMQRATEFIWMELRPDLALLLSSPEGVPLYQSLEWQTIPGPVMCDQPDRTLNYTDTFPDGPAMVLLPAGRATPTGEVDLCGLPW